MNEREPETQPAELTRRRAVRLGLFAACAALTALGACNTPPKQAATPAPDPQPTPPAPPTEPEPAAPPPPKPLDLAEMPTVPRNLRRLLDEGQEDAALDLIARVLATDPTHRLALSLQRQIKDDPARLYGAESFAYRVTASDTLASIANRYLKDSDQFYGLARYNGIKVPRSLQVGQMIKVPGKPGAANPQPPAPTTPPSPPSSPTPQPPTPAPSPSPQPSPPPPAPPPEPQASPELRKIEQCAGEARRAQENQNACRALDRWNCILELDPTHAEALRGRERALGNIKRLGKAC